MSFHIDPQADALIVVDVQRDFCPGGALPVPNGDAVVPGANRALAVVPWLTVATRDWHPPAHCSFIPQGGIWPVHCVAGTPGAAFHPDLDVGRIRWIVDKATTREMEAYSGFQGTELAARLTAAGIRRLFVCGLATDYCVKATALDGRRAGFEVVLLTDAIRAVEVKPGDSEGALAEMRAAGVSPARSDELRA
ncbi:MAG: nicotinamidase [candidate division NC10 bacterium]|nr:nicotinamidase [candidate division NC10 bacterium]